MNYIELHIGDYEKATAHLTACEDGIYGRMIRRYYDTEAPLPLDLKAIQRFVRARSRDEKDAVETLLEEFFMKGDDGWHHKRCDEEIARYSEKREKAQRSANARWNRSERNANASADAMRTHSEGNAHHTPVTSHQSSIGSTEEHTEGTTGNRPSVVGGQPSTATQTVIILRKLGFRVTSQNPDLIAALTEGCTPQAIVAMAELYPGKPAGYVIAAARRQRAEGPREITANTGPPRQANGGASPPMSKTLQALHELEAVKNGTGLDHPRDQLRLAEADPAQP